MVLVVGHGEDMESAIAGYFLERNMVISKTIGQSWLEAKYIVTKYVSEDDK